MTTKKYADKKPKMRRYKASNLHTVLPQETIKGIKEGTVDVMNVAAILAVKQLDDNSKTKLAELRMHQERAVATGLAKMAFGVPPGNSALDHSISIAIVKLATDLLSGLHMIHLYRALRVKEGLPFDDFSYWLVKNFQQKHDQLLSDWTVEIIKISGHPPGFHSPAFNTSLDHFRTIFNGFRGTPPEHAQGAMQDALHHCHKAQFACQMVAAGGDFARTTCWECGVDNQDVFKCSGCDAARYCGPECQKKSWKEGHKTRCKMLQKLYQVFRTNENVITKALKAGTITPSSTIAPNPHIDICILLHVFRAMELGVDMHPFTEDAVLTKAYKAIEDMENEESHFEYLDVSEKESCCSGKNEESEIYHLKVKHAVHAFCSIVVEGECQGISKIGENAVPGMHKKGGDGSVVTIEGFLEIYKSFVPGRQPDRILDLNSWDLYALELFETLRNEYHK